MKTVLPAIMLHSRYIISGLIGLLISYCSLAQSDSTAQREVKPFQVEIVVDLGKLNGLLADYESKYEGGIAFRFNDRYAVVGEFGSATLTPNEPFENGRVESSGSYWRIGGNYKIQKDADNNFYLGLLWAQSSFDENGRYVIQDEFWGDIEKTYDRTGLSARWLELTLGTETVLIKKPDIPDWLASIYLGLNLRLRIMVDYDLFAPVDTYVVPGYGRTFDNSVPAVNLYLRYKI